MYLIRIFVIFHIGFRIWTTYLVNIRIFNY